MMPSLDSLDSRPNITSSHHPHDVTSMNTDEDEDEGNRAMHILPQEKSVAVKQLLQEVMYAISNIP